MFTIEDEPAPEQSRRSLITETIEDYATIVAILLIAGWLTVEDKVKRAARELRR